MLPQKFAQTCRNIQTIEFPEYNNLPDSSKQNYLEFYKSLKTNLLSLFYEIILSHILDNYGQENYLIYFRIYDAIQLSYCSRFTLFIEEKSRDLENLTDDAKRFLNNFCDVFLNEKYDFNQLDKIEEKDRKIILWGLFSKEYPNICFSKDQKLVDFVNQFLSQNKMGNIEKNVKNSPTKFSKNIVSNIESSTFFIEDLYRKIGKYVGEEKVKISKAIKSTKIDEVAKEEPPKKERYRKEKIPSTLRNVVWNQFFQDVAIGKCPCCKTEPITRGNFVCGHIISEKRGGETNVQNLRPICSQCNSSMGTQNMDDFMKKYGFDKL